MARPIKYDGDTVMCVRPQGDSRLKKHSDRRAIIDLMVENGGCMSLKEIDDHFGFTMRSKVLALMRAGWLEVKG